jgi:hypothetical protein
MTYRRLTVPMKAPYETSEQQFDPVLARAPVFFAFRNVSSRMAPNRHSR